MAAHCKFALACAFALCSFLAGCNKYPSTAFSRFHDIPQEGMPQNWAYIFAPDAPFDSQNAAYTSSQKSRQDSIAIAKLHSGNNSAAVLVVRYTKQCPVRQLVVDIEEACLESQDTSANRTVIDLFDINGTPLGKGAYGVYEVSDTIHENWKMPQGYSLAVLSTLPRQSTKGIKAVGLVISSPPESTP